MLKILFKLSALAVFAMNVAFAGDVPNEVRDFFKFANKEAWETHLATIIQERKAQNLDVSSDLKDEKSWVWKGIGKSLAWIGTKTGFYNQDEIIDIRQEKTWSAYTKDDCRDLFLRNVVNFTCATPGGINDISRCLDDIVKSLKSSEKYQKTCIFGKVQGDKFEANLDEVVSEVKDFAAELRLKEYLNKMRNINGRQKMVNFANGLPDNNLPYGYFDLEEVAPDVKACFCYLKKMPNDDRSKNPPRIVGYIQFEKFMDGKIRNDANLKLRRYVLDKPLRGAKKWEKMLNFFLSSSHTVTHYLFEPRYQFISKCIHSIHPGATRFYKLSKASDIMQRLSSIEQDLISFIKKNGKIKLVNDVVKKDMNFLINRLYWLQEEVKPYFTCYKFTPWDGKHSTYDDKLAELWSEFRNCKKEVERLIKYNECDLISSIDGFLGTAKKGGSREIRRIVNPGTDFLETPKENQIIRYDSKLKFFHEFHRTLDLVGDNIKQFQGEW